MAWREEAHLGDVYIEGAVDLREGSNAAAQGGFGVGVKAKLAAGTVTIASADVAVENNSDWTLHGSVGAVLEDKGMTVNTTDDRIDMDFIGTKYCRIEGKISLAPAATNTDLLVLQVRKNNTVVLFETASQDVADTAPALFCFDFYDTLANGDYVNLWVENEDTTANILLAVYVEASGVVAAGAAVTESGYVQITGA